MKRRDRKIENLEFQIDFEDGVTKVDVKVVVSEMGNWYELKMTDSEKGTDLTEMFLADPDEDPAPIYTEADLINTVADLFEIETTDFDVSGVAEWDEAVEFEDLGKQNQIRAGRLLADIYEEIKAGTVCQNAIESEDKLYLRFGDIILEVRPKFITP